MRNSATLHRRLAGFTIIEVLMAAAILTVGFMGLVEAVTMCSGMMDEARRQTLATQILNNEIEKMRFYQWTDPQLQATVVQNPIDSAHYPDSPFLDAISASGATYSLSLSGSFVDPLTNANVASDTGLYERIFTVTWVVKSSRRDKSGNPVTFTHSRTNTSYFGKYGLNLSDQRS
ncbi:MAG TPA: prepilin-type N-terminal cleavage/methylation domain-containing protein [Lacunisphaera sp.]